MHQLFYKIRTITNSVLGDNTYFANERAFGRHMGIIEGVRGGV